MIAVDDVKQDKDLEQVASIIDMMADWDATESRALGITTDELNAVHYGYSIQNLKSRFSGPGAGLVLGRWNDKAAGCIAYAPFDSRSAEIHKFFVNPVFRGKGVGKALLQSALTRIEAGEYQSVLLQTAVFMKEAIQLYERFGFRRSMPFRDIPETFVDMEVFMELQLS